MEGCPVPSSGWISICQELLFAVQHPQNAGNAATFDEVLLYGNNQENMHGQLKTQLFSRVTLFVNRNGIEIRAILNSCEPKWVKTSRMHRPCSKKERSCQIGKIEKNNKWAWRCQLFAQRASSGLDNKTTHQWHLRTKMWEWENQWMISRALPENQNFLPWNCIFI